MLAIIEFKPVGFVCKSLPQTPCKATGEKPHCEDLLTKGQTVSAGQPL